MHCGWRGSHFFLAMAASLWFAGRASDLLGTVGSLVGAVFSVFTVGLSTFYLTANGPRSAASCCRACPRAATPGAVGLEHRHRENGAAPSAPGPCWRSSTAG